MLNAYRQWQTVTAGGSGNGWRFCDKNFVSHTGFTTIKGIIQQLYSQLRSAGLLEESGGRAAPGAVSHGFANRHQADWALIQVLPN